MGGIKLLRPLPVFMSLAGTTLPLHKLHYIFWKGQVVLKLNVQHVLAQKESGSPFDRGYFVLIELNLFAFHESKTG